MGRIVIVIFLISISLINILATNVEGQQSDILRIHIIANSNSPKDQFVKYQVRDAILDQFNSELRKHKKSEDIEEFLNENIKEIVLCANKVLKENGFEYQANGSMGSFNFPTRLYLDTLYPGGEYKAVKIVLGEGSGDNWWCVMFPPLCLVGEVNNETLTNSEASATREVEYDFFLVSWIKVLVNAIKNLFI